MRRDILEHVAVAQRRQIILVMVYACELSTAIAILFALRLLIVEDNRNLVRLVKQGLTKAGFAVDLDSNLSEAHDTLATTVQIKIARGVGYFLSEGE